MLRKSYLTLFLAFGLIAASGIAVSAQTAPLRGKVEMKNAEGVTEPVVGAAIDVYQMDIKGKQPSTKTNKKGEFAYAGVPLGTFVVVVSAPNIKAELQPNVRAGSENVLITVIAGDGKRPNEKEVRQALSAPPTKAAAQTTATAATETAPVMPGGTPAPTPAPAQKPAEMTADQKKAQAEYEKQVADITAKNAKTQGNDALVKKALEDGNKAFESKNYDVAISKYQEGVTAVPDFAGSTPVLLNNKSQALLQRAIISYNQSVKETDPAAKKANLEAAKKDLDDVVTGSDSALALLKSATSTDAATQKNYDTNKFTALVNRKEGYRLMSRTRVDVTKAKETLTAFEEYIAAETDAKKKADAQLALGDALREDNDADNAIIAYRKALETSPDSPDVLAGLGLSLFNAGVSSAPENTAQMQEGLNYMQKFADTAPDNHPLKESVKGAVTYLKEKQLTPQKVNKGATKKKS